MDYRSLVDVIILSYAKSAREYRLTRTCLESLRASERDIGFDVVVAETSSEAELARISHGEGFSVPCKVIFPEPPFNYNRYLQRAFRELAHSNAPYVLISNNDVEFQPGFATALLWGLERFHSVSPWCPGHHEEHFSGHLPCYPGYRTCLELCGWNILFRREILRTIPFDELFPIDFEFWFQDNYYAAQLRRHSLTHALIRDARVVHLFAQSHELLEEGRKDQVRHGAWDLFQRKVGALDMRKEEPTAGRIALTVVVSVDFSCLGAALWSLLEKLNRQAIGKSVEVLALIANSSPAHNDLQCLAEWSQGEHIAFVDPEEPISDDYIEKLLSRMNSTSADELEIGATRSIFGNRVTRTEWARRHLRQSHLAGNDSTAAAQLSNSPELTICLLAVPSRVGGSFAKLVCKLAVQANDRPVEIVALVDNKCSSIGRKRNLLLSHAKGRFITFVDDDDDVAYDYVTTLVDAIHQDPDVDCIVFDAWVTLDGGDGRLCRYGIEYEDHDTPDAYYRKPNHICCLRRDIVGSVPFEDISYHEDFRWATAIHGRLTRQTRVDRTLYAYQYSSTGSESGPASARTSEKPDRQLGFEPTLTSASISRKASMAPIATLPIFGFMHVALLPGWRAIVEEQLLKLQVSGLYDKSQRIFIGLVGKPREALDLEDEKVRVACWNADVTVGEVPTLDHLHGFCQSHECRVFYIHTKGVSRQSESTRDWRHLMEHFVITRHEECLQTLDTHDACGVNWHGTPLPHFSGNFWWTHSHYVRTLPSLATHAEACARIHVGDCTIPDWWSCEFWIGAHPKARIANLHESGVNHYDVPYPLSRYTELREVVTTAAFESPTAWRGLENRVQELLEPIGPIRRIVEIGVEFGFSLFSLATAVPQATVIGIDPYQELESDECARLLGMGSQAVLGSSEAEAWVRRHLVDYGNVWLLRARGEEVARRLIGQVDVVHLDSVHVHGDLVREFQVWEPLVRPGGCILFHDTESFPNDVGRFFAELPGPKAHLAGCNGLGAWYKAPLPCRPG
jgi:hypothetical protein